MPNISIIVPVYNVEPYIHRCIDSILKQTYQDYEVILVDDGSPDNCGKICDEYAVKDNRIHVIHQVNSGLSAARNSGIDWVISNASSQYITFVDSDDWVEKTYLETFIDGIKLGGEIVCTTSKRISSNGATVRCFYTDLGWHLSNPDDAWAIPDYMKDSAWAKLFPVRLFKTIRFPVGRIYEDIFTTYQLIFMARRIAFRDCATYNYLDREGSISTGKWTISQLDMFDAYNSQIQYLIANGHQSAARYVQGKVRNFKISTAKRLEHIDKQISDRLYSEVINDFETTRIEFWYNRGVYKVVSPIKYMLMWPIAMLQNAITQGRTSWLARESLSTIKHILF